MESEERGPRLPRGEGVGKAAEQQCQDIGQSVVSSVDSQLREGSSGLRTSVLL